MQLDYYQFICFNETEGNTYARSGYLRWSTKDKYIKQIEQCELQPLKPFSSGECGYDFFIRNYLLAGKFKTFIDLDELKKYLLD